MLVLTLMFLRPNFLKFIDWMINLFSLKREDVLRKGMTVFQNHHFFGKQI